MSKFILLPLLVTVSLVCGYLIGQQSKSPEISNTISAEELKKPDVISFLQKENIVSITSWEDDQNFFAVVREFDKPCDDDDSLHSCQELSIYNEDSTELFKMQEFGIYSIKFTSLMPNSRQLIVETNSGGTDNNLEIIDYRNGKFSKLENPYDTAVRGGWWTMPAYRSGANGAYSKPSQLIAVQQIGGADNDPKASVFRYQDNKFQKIGEIKMNALGDLIETQIAKRK